MHKENLFVPLYLMDSLYLNIWLLTSAYYDSSIKYKQPTLYISSPFLRPHFNLLIKMIKKRNKYPTFNVSFPLEKQSSAMIFMLAPFLFLKSFGSWCTDRRYSRHYMLAFPLFWVFTSTYYYSSVKEKYPKFYFSWSCFFTTFQLTGTNDNEVDNVQMGDIAKIICYSFHYYIKNTIADI